MKKNILIIDDSKTQLNSLKILLSRYNYNIYTATDGNSGYCQIFEIAPDIIISDIIMPDLNGYQLCKLIKNNEYSKKIPIILLTVLDQNIDKFWGQKSGADLFLSKAAPIEEIYKNIEDLIEKNPICEDLKNKILNININEKSVQNKITNLLDDALIHSTLMNEFRLLSENIDNDYDLACNIFKLLLSIMDYDACAIWLSNYDINSNKIFINGVNCKFTKDSRAELMHNMLETVDKYIKETGAFIDTPVGFSEIDSFVTLKNCFLDNSFEMINNNYKNNCENTIIISLSQFKTISPFVITFDNKILGCVCFYNKQHYSYKMFKFIEIIIKELKLLLRIKKLYAQTTYLSVTDGLTNLYNRRQFDNILEKEFLRSKRYLSNLTLCIIDVDYFKKVNDNYGHKAGDLVLNELATIISQSFRKSDFVFRYGGEEFMLILSETSLKQAKYPVERLKSIVEKHNFEFENKKFNLTISVGMAEVNGDVTSPDILVKNSDIALYKAKNTGRNKVVMYE